MLTIHKTKIVGKCPLGCVDIYEAEFHVQGDKVLQVEKIQKVIDEMTAAPIFQEDLTRYLNNFLGCKVITRGSHGRFETECIIDPGGS